MERAILKTLIYSDIFDYPLTLREIHKWLVNKKTTLRQVEKALGKLVNRLQVTGYRELYFLIGRDGIVRKRLQNEKQSKIYFRKAKIIGQILKIIPWIKLVGVSGGLAMENTGKKDDIDLILITAKNRMWISRLLALGLLSLAGQRRKRNDLPSKVAGKLCINTLLAEDRLEQASKDIYLAHEVLQIKVLWQRDGMYSKYLEDNSWAFKFLPNWMSKYQVVSSKYYVSKNKKHNTKYIIHNTILNVFEKIAKDLQLKIMGTPRGLERIEEGALYFHPKDYGEEILAKFKLKIAPLDK